MVEEFDKHAQRLQLRFVVEHDEWSNEIIAGVEHALGHSFPEDYRSFVRKYGLSYGSNVVIPDQISPQLSGPKIEVFFGVDPAGLDYDLVEMWDCFRDRIPAGHNLVPIANASGSLICISIAGPTRGAVYIWGLEHITGGDEVDLLAPTFTAFLTMLYIDKS